MNIELVIYILIFFNKFNKQWTSYSSCISIRYKFDAYDIKFIDDGKN
jgi:hypothetical protein